MKTPSAGCIGIDFGTTNTYLTRVFAHTTSFQSEDMSWGSQKGIPTAVLYHKENHQVAAYGQDALEEWVNLGTDRKQKWVFGANFKTQIAHQPVARLQAGLFLGALRRDMEKSGWFGKEGLHYVCGLPSIRQSEYTSHYQGILKELGFQPHTLMEEPLGALFSHIHARDLSQEQALRGVLVVDFGGGTLDIVWIRDFEIQKVWGNPFMGGRVLDDLLYQWFIDHSEPQVAKRIREDRNESYIRHILFKQIKERYSRWMMRDTSHPFRDRIVVGDRDYGSFIAPTREAFEDAMRHFRPSETLRPDWGGSWISNPDGTLDMIRSFQSVLMEGFKDSESIRQDVSLIVMTGGSSRWGFFQDLMTEEGFFPHTPFIRSASPESSISHGLGLAMASREKATSVRQELDLEEPGLMNRVIPQIRSIYSQTAHTYIRQIKQKLYPVLVEEWDRYCQTGGKISSLQKRWEQAAIQIMESNQSQWLNEFQLDFQSRCTMMLEKEVHQWFDSLSIPLQSLPDFRTTELSQTLGIDQRISGSLYALVSSMMTILMGGMGVLAASSGIGFLSAGPLGLAGGFFSGVVLSLLLAFGLKKNISQKMHEIDFRPYLLGVLFFPKKRVVDKLKRAMDKQLSMEHVKAMQAFDQELDIIKKEIRRVLHQTLREVYCSLIFDYLKLIEDAP